MFSTLDEDKTPRMIRLALANNHGIKVPSQKAECSEVNKKTVSKISQN